MRCFLCLYFEFSRCRNKVEKNYLEKWKPLTFLFVSMYFQQLNYGYIARTMSVFEGYAKRFFADLVSCVNAKLPRLAWMDTVTQKCLTMGLYVNAKMERYFSVFSHNWLPFLLWHVEIGAVLQTPIIKHLTTMYQLSIHGTGYCSAFKYPIGQRHKLRILLNHVLGWLATCPHVDIRWLDLLDVWKGSALKFLITHWRRNLYVPTSSELTSSPSAQSPRSLTHFQPNIINS